MTIATEPPAFNPPDADNPSLPAEVASSTKASERPITDFSLSELVGQFIRFPGSTLSALGGALAAPTTKDAPPPPVEASAMRGAIQRVSVVALPRFAPPIAFSVDTADDDSQAAPAEDLPKITATSGTSIRAISVLAGLVVAFIIAQIATNALVANRAVDISLTPITFAGMLLLFSAAIFSILVWADVRFQRLPPLVRSEGSAEKPDLQTLLLRIGLRVVYGTVAALITWLGWNANFSTQYTQFTSTGTFFWIVSIVAWVLTFVEGDFDPLKFLARLVNGTTRVVRNTLRFRLTWTLIALIAILITGAYFRFNNLGAFPPDMTSDHVEKVRDAWKIDEGLRPIFLENNGGREPGFFYFLTLLHNLTGLGFDFDLVKTGSGLWGMAMILAAWWMGRALVGDEDRDLGNLTGVLMAAMVAVSYWHTMLSRLGLRIVSTTLVATVVLIFFVRALRHNRRNDWILAGLALGGGMFFYQATRMLPVIIIVGALFMLLFRVRSWRGLRITVVNGLALVIVALAVFAPLGRYMIELPEFFWSRSSGRLFGEDVIEIRDAQGNLTGSRLADNQDRIEALGRNLPVLGSNLIRSAWMFNWQGDRAWVTGSPNGEPQLDTFVGSFFVLGVGLMLVRAVRRRDPADLLFPVSVLIMLLPTALSIAFVIEVPSATRASGTFPLVYFMAAFALAVTLRMITAKLNGLLIRVIAVGLVVVGLAAGAAWNFDTYFRVAMRHYRDSTLPYSQAGDILRGFSESVGSSGNAFMIAYPYWWDHRALAIEAGDIRWNNGVLEDNLKQRLIDMIEVNMGTPYELRPDRQMLYFLHKDAIESLAVLQTMFPDGVVTTVDSYNETRNFMLYTVQPIGCAWVQDNIKRESSVCPPR
jgi:hypothetical protein